MAAIITDQIRILNAKNFIAGVTTSTNAYYSFIGLTNATDFSSTWDQDPPSPKDSFDEENQYWDSMVALKKINSSDVRQVVTKRNWSSGTTFDMYRHDYSRTKTAAVSGATNLYAASYYVINSDFRVYLCIQNGTTPDTPNGAPSLDEPTHIDLEPRAAGTSGDGYLWKYLYSIKPSDIVKFEATAFMPVPLDWGTSTENELVRDNAVDGSIKVVTITNRGAGVGPVGATRYANVPIKGDGTGAECTIVTTNDQRIDSITVTNQGSGYTYGNVDLSAGNVPTGTTRPTFDVIISPQGGHGADIYRELGANRVLIYSRLENDTSNPDFITGNQFSRVGLCRDPLAFGSSNILTLQKASAVYALKLTGAGSTTTTFTADSEVTQEIGIGSTAVGRVINYDSQTGVLKYWQDRRLAISTDGSAPTYGFELFRFNADPAAGAGTTIFGGTNNLTIDTNFGTSEEPGLSTSINSRTFNLGMSFVKGVANPEVEKYSGDIIYVDNRAAVTRSSQQKEDIKIVLEF